MNQRKKLRLTGRGRAVAALLLVLFALPLSFTTLHGQRLDAPEPGDTIYELRHLTGTRTIGWIAEQRGDTIVFRSVEGGEWRLDRRTAALRRARGRVVRGEFWREDQTQSRLFFAPTGRVLHEGQGYAGLFTILPFVGFGITEDFTLAGGIPPWGGSLVEMPLWIAPKLRVKEDPGTEASIGGFYLQLPGGDPFESDGVVEEELFRLALTYGMITLGTPDQAIHLGVGASRSFGSSGLTRGLAVVGGEYRIGRRYKWITENWLVTPSYPILSLGLRSVGERWTFDYGLMGLPSEEGAPFVPIISFSYAFGAGR